jgi:hypothetical protein
MGIYDLKSRKNMELFSIMGCGNYSVNPVNGKETNSKNLNEILRITCPKDESPFPYLFCNFTPSLP